MSDAKDEVQAILDARTLSEFRSSEAIELLGTFVDKAYDAKRSDALRHVATLALTIDLTDASPADRTSLDYYLGNVWNGVKCLAGPFPSGSWEWDQTELENEIICLRRALASPGFQETNAIRRCQILTNLANCYDTTGRFVEAIDAWNDALEIEPRFGMARANRAVGRWSYARALYDPGHAILFARQAWNDLEPTTLRGLEPGSEAYFAATRVQIERALNSKDTHAPLDLEAWPHGVSQDEVAYRQWCLDRRLFLNPLNDLGPFPIAARDVLCAPSIVAPIGEGPRYHGFFNQLKQEYCTARWFAYDSLHRHATHLGDHEVLLFNTLDYPSYSIATETLKLSFRASYSLFDKIAYFLNAYLKLQIPERAVSFRGIWYADQQKRRGVRPEFKDRVNWPLRGLFWLAKDLYEDGPEFRAVIDPAAERLNSIRNHLEHKYLKLHLPMWTGSAAPGSMQGLIDDLAESLYLTDFQNMTLKLLSLSRAAIIYLSLGVHQEERIRAAQRPADAITPPMFLDVWEDEWKT